LPYRIAATVMADYRLSRETSAVSFPRRVQPGSFMSLAI